MYLTVFTLKMCICYYVLIFLVNVCVSACMNVYAYISICNFMFICA